MAFNFNYSKNNFEQAIESIRLNPCAPIALAWNRFLLVILFAVITPSVASANQNLLFEGAETVIPNYTVVPSGIDIVCTTVNGDTGNHSFHFTHPNNRVSLPPDPWLMLPAVSLGSNSKMEFKSMLRTAGSSEEAHVQISVDGGATWQDLPTTDGVFTQIRANAVGQPGSGSSGEQVFTMRVVDLSGTQFTNKSVRIRFGFIIAPGGYNYYLASGDSYGWFVDDISIQSGGNRIFFEGGESATPTYTVQPAGLNLLEATVYASDNTRSFHFTHPNNRVSLPPDPWLMLPAVSLGSNSKMEFKSMLRTAGSSEEAHVQISVDGGATWQDLPTTDGVFTQIRANAVGQPGSGSSGEQVFTMRVVDLSGTQFTNKSVRIRFGFIIAPGGYNYYLASGDSYGWFVDDITVIDNSVQTSPNNAPTITGSKSGQPVNDNATILPFASVTIADIDVPAQTLTVTVTLDNVAKGAFTRPNGFANAGGGVYTFSGTAAAAATAIRGLVFSPTANRVQPGLTETTIFTISTSDGIAPAVTESTTTVISTSVNDAPTIFGTVSGQPVNDNATNQPFVGVIIADVDSPAQTQTVSVRLDTAAKGSFTALNGFANAGGGLYTFSGTAAAATVAIRTLVFAPTANRVQPGLTETTTFTISTSDGIAAAVTDSTTTVVSTSVNDAPVAQDGTIAANVMSGSISATLAASDVDGNLQGISIVRLPIHGRIALAGVDSRTVTYTPDFNTIESDSFDFIAIDSDGLVSNVATMTIASADSDRDGLLDEWELRTFGNLLQGADGDFDGDGQTNFQEYLAGTNAASPNSMFIAKISPVGGSGGGAGGGGNGSFEIVWGGVPGNIYTVEHTTNLGSTWSPLEGATNIIAASTGGEIRRPITPPNHPAIGASHIFYRVSVRVPASSQAS